MANGWYNESKRHSLAAKGVKVGSKINNFHVVLFDKADLDKDGLENKYDCEPFNSEQQGKMHDFFYGLLEKARLHHSEADQEKITDLQLAAKTIKNTEELRKFWSIASKVMLATGIAFVIIVVPQLIGGTTHVVLNSVSGQLETIEGSYLADFLRGAGGIGTHLLIKPETRQKIIDFEVHMLDKLSHHEVKNEKL